MMKALIVYGKKAAAAARVQTFARQHILCTRLIDPLRKNHPKTNHPPSKNPFHSDVKRDHICYAEIAKRKIPNTPCIPG